MANPQTENGHTRIANELLEAFLRAEMPDSARRVFLFILRQTYGYQKKHDRLAISQILAGTGLKNSRRVEEALAHLRERGMITRERSGLTGIVKNYESWDGGNVPEVIHKTTYPHPRKNAEDIRGNPRSVPPRKSADTKERKKILKKGQTVVDNSGNKKTKKPYIEGDPASRDPVTGRWRVRIHTGEWLDYVGSAKPEWRDA